MGTDTGDGPGAPDGEPAPALLDGRIWVDGCFDFFHHGLTPHPPPPSLPPPPPLDARRARRPTDARRPGHAGAMVQARQLGDELYVGVHSDEDILANKGPTVMTLAERSVLAPTSSRARRRRAARVRCR